MPLGFPAPPDLVQMEVPSRADCSSHDNSPRRVPDEDMQGRYIHRQCASPDLVESDLGDSDPALPAVESELLLAIPYENETEDFERSSSSFYQSASEMLRGMDDSLHLSDFLAASSSRHHTPTELCR